MGQHETGGLTEMGSRDNLYFIKKINMPALPFRVNVRSSLEAKPAGFQPEDRLCDVSASASRD